MPPPLHDRALDKSVVFPNNTIIKEIPNIVRMSDGGREVYGLGICFKNLAN